MYCVRNISTKRRVGSRNTLQYRSLFASCQFPLLTWDGNSLRKSTVALV